MTGIIKRILSPKGIAMIKYRINLDLFSAFDSKKKCPVCGYETVLFKPFGMKKMRSNALCSQCYSLERHRAEWLWLDKFIKTSNKKLDILHSAPELCLFNKLLNNTAINYFPCDLSPSNEHIHKIDLTKIELEDSSFDLIICNHVLEHILEDMTALKEIYRILREDGVAILSIPIMAKVTFEDETIVIPEDRYRAFHQEDHVRICGLDYVDRIKDVGFKVERIEYSESERKLYAFDKERHPSDIFYICRKS